MDGRDRPATDRDDLTEIREIDADTYTDMEVESRLADWIETNAVENKEPRATLYKFTGPNLSEKEQCDHYKGVFPSRHDIGLEYGSGKYMLIISNGAHAKEKIKGTTVRFTLSKAYDEKSRKFHAEKALQSIVPTPATQPLAPIAPVDNSKAMADSFSMVQNMMQSIMSMFKPILERAMTPPPLPALPTPVADPLKDYQLSRQIMKESMTDNLQIMSDFQRKLLEIQNGNNMNETDDNEDLPEEKKSMFERIIELAGPFLDVLAQNNLAAKTAALGIKAAPQFKAVLSDVPLARKIIRYVDEKEGPQRADTVLKNLGVDRTAYGIGAPAPTGPRPAASVVQNQKMVAKVKAVKQIPRKATKK